MPRSDWLSYAAIAGLIIIVCLGSYLSPWITRTIPGEAYGVAHTQNAEDQHQAANQAATPKEKRPPSAEYEPSCNKREDADLCAQLRMADAAEFQSNLNSAGVVLLILSLFFTAWAAVAASKAAVAAEKSVSVSREIGRDQSRAYVQAKKAHADWRGDKLPIVTITVVNSGQTPAKWFGYRCVVVSRDLPSRPFNRTEVESAKRTCWYGLGPNDKRTFNVAPDILSPFLDQSGHQKNLLRIDGVIEYETFFGELYASEFSFCGNIDQLNAIEHGFGEALRMKPIKLSHTSQELRSYFYVGESESQDQRQTDS